MHSCRLIIPVYGLIIITAATFGAFALGNVIAWPSSVLEKIDLSDSTESWIVSIFMIGAALVPWIACNATRLSI